MRRTSLATQVLAVNAALITATVLAAAVVAQLDVTGAESRRQALVLVAAILSTVLVNGLVVRRRFAPLEHLIDVMERVDLGAARDGEVRAEVDADSAEVARLTDAFNRMLGRLEDERARTAGAVLQGQEAERARLARDLHDEANQALTGVLLRLAATAQDAPPALRDELRATQEVATQAMDELLRLARELRPAALDDHGLAVALAALLDRAPLRASLDAGDCDLDALQPDAQVVVYRVVQEALSNAIRHGHAQVLHVAARAHGGEVVVTVRDDGDGFDVRRVQEGEGGLGLTGMRERARLAGGAVAIRSAPGYGTEVELRLQEALACAS
ncbi:sensor histidine kinase [Conexibacter sp. SYSU D00693]|uniref:sensor histidine kinase n=1 Tax=Conexibacter sp. SYSU D00693 TaxID=2812560 RepID=UPI00196A590C|nr:ATP-binding protein [Conexibacter sp. SYSU D00693]